MPLELRQIIFLPEELQYAVESFNRTATDKVFYGRLAGCRVDSAPAVYALVQDLSAQKANIEEVRLPDDFVLGALGKFCRENNITLPADGKRSVAVRRDYVVLEIASKLSP